MKVFVWQRIDKATTSWHPEGGVVVFAENEARARQLALNQGALIREDEKPDEVRNVTSGKEAVYIMPDAVCC
jgi:hypothetical protein